jgi:hypothetical protein
MGRRLADVVVALADKPSVRGQAELARLLPGAQLYVKMIGVSGEVSHGQKIVVGREQPVSIRTARLPNGTEMLLAFVAPPKDLAPNEVVGTMTGRELLTMAARADANGILVAVEDARQSWTALGRDAIASILAGLG